MAELLESREMPADKAAGEVFAEREKQRRAEEHPRQHAQERLRRRVNHQDCAGYAADDARDDQRHHHAAGKVQALPVGAAAGGDTYP